MPKHSQAAKCFSTGIYAGLKSFKELEDRISALPTEKEKGDAFEVFVEAYLSTQPLSQAKTVWPQITAPSAMLTRLGLPISRDLGTDGLVELNDGRIVSYQAKFYTGRPSLTWTILSTFFAISDRVSHTLLVTNSDTLSSTIEQREKFFAIRGMDFDGLTQSDFSTIEEWLKGKSSPKEVPSPRPHQEKALTELLKALDSSDRATAIMACGTGKTLVSLWAAERIRAKTIIVFVPSLALIQQTLHAWGRSTTLQDFAYLCVCSDPTVVDSGDEVIVRKSELDFEVTTTPEEVKSFLENPYQGTKIVFSTYLSADVVGKAVNGRNLFDLGIFDEAHKTAGRESKTYAFALSNANLPIRKRIFMTATPRHYNVLKRDKSGEAKLVYSMDVPEDYGVIAHKLTFADAAVQGIISPYKVVISVVTNEMVSKELLRQGRVLVDGEEIHAQQVANQIALSAAVEKHGASKIITFHKNIQSAKSFVSDGSEGVRGHMKEFLAFHVNGSMPTVERKKIMDEFRGSKQSVISNAKCLTEGVDVPAVDMVAFLSPKRSTVDIVQATGRAMRKSPNKKCGYILLPLYLEVKAGETIAAAIRRGNYEEIWDVLAALQEQDEVLADIIRTMRQNVSRKGFDDSRLREHIEVLGPEIILEDLRKSISVVCLENLSTDWDENFGKLIAFKELNGHCNVPQNYTDSPELGGWVANNRRWGKNGMISSERIARLNEIGFSWDPWQDLWMQSYNELQKYFAENGNSNIPLGKPGERSKLALWVLTQRVKKKKGELPDDRIALLEKLNFEWDRHDAIWEKNHEALVNFKKKHGHCNVPTKYPENSQLGVWVMKQRRLKRQGALPQEKIVKLENLGFLWESSRS